MREIRTSKVVGYFGVRKIDENQTQHIHQKIKRLGFKGEFHWLCVQTIKDLCSIIKGYSILKMILSHYIRFKERMLNQTEVFLHTKSTSKRITKYLGIRL